MGKIPMISHTSWMHQQAYFSRAFVIQNLKSILILCLAPGRELLKEVERIPCTAYNCRCYLTVSNIILVSLIRAPFISDGKKKQTKSIFVSFFDSFHPWVASSRYLDTFACSILCQLQKVTHLQYLTQLQKVTHLQYFVLVSEGGRLILLKQPFLISGNKMHAPTCAICNTEKYG